MPANSLHIEDPEAQRLAAAISQLTGESVSRVVTQALKDRWDRLRHPGDKATVEELLAIAQRISSKVKGAIVDHAALLYDENGLPK